MAVFLVNNCKFRGCSQKYSSLRELIQHIEAHHIASDPQVLEKQELQQPSSLPLSYVLRLSVSEAATVAKLQQQVRQRKNSLSPVPSLSSYRSSTPTGSEFDDEDHHSDNSDDSWVTQEELTSEIILGMMSSHKEADADKPFVCPVPGCKKRYKNVNGIKYHAKHGHRKDIRVKKPFRCKCGKSYSSASGLRHHTLVSHQVPVCSSNNIIKTSDTTISKMPSRTPLTNTTPTPILLPTSTRTPLSPNTPNPILLPTSTPSSKHPTLPYGSLTFQSPSGGIQVAVPVNQLLTLPRLDSTKRGSVGENWTHVVDSTPSLDMVGCYESVETFTGLDSSVDETKAD